MAKIERKCTSLTESTHYCLQSFAVRAPWRVRLATVERAVCIYRPSIEKGERCALGMLCIL